MSDEYISAAQTAEILGISRASIKNWERHGLLTSADGLFSAPDVYTLLENIIKGDVRRLGSRANKKQASGRLHSSGHSLSKNDADELKIFLKRCSAYAMDLNTIIFTAVIKQLNHAGLITLREDDDLQSLNNTAFRHPSVKKFITQWHNEAVQSGSLDSVILKSLPELPIVDPAGCIYQAMLRRGERAVKGSFYTPEDTAAEMTASVLAGLKDSSQKTALQNLIFLDPCCGSGQYLLSFAESGALAENIIGFDSDPIAVRIATANLMARFPETDFIPAVYCTDSLEITSKKMYQLTGKRPDVIITNPPWGAEHKKGTSEDSFSRFLRRGCSLVNEGGIVSMLLPESVTNIKRHRAVREEILKEAEITSIKEHGRIFKNVFTPVITLEFRKKAGIDKNPQTVRYLNNSDYIFDFYLKSKDLEIIEKIEKLSSESLAGKARWALGIVTGDNRRYLRESLTEGAEPVITGSDIHPGMIEPASKFILFEKDRFQQAAAEDLYRNPEKIVYRFISKNLVCAVDRSGSLTLNSANIIIPDESFINCSLLSALFNSDLYNFVYRKRFNALKVLRKNLEALPLPAPASLNPIRPLLKSEPGMGKITLEAAPVSDIIEEMLYDYFCITEKEIQYIRSETR